MGDWGVNVRATRCHPADGPVTCAIYAKEKGLLDEPMATFQVDRKA